jgi:hypothetical protein
VSVGHADGFVAVRAGPWAVRLPVVPGRYPDVAAVVPRSRPTVGGIDEADARDLLSKLKDLPGGDPDHPVTLALAGGVSVLAADDRRTVQVAMPRSPAAGPAVRVALNRTALARGLKLGCLTAKVWAVDKPVVFEGGAYTLVAAPLGEDDVVRDRVAAVTPATPPTPDDTPTHPVPWRTAVKTDPPPRPHPPPETPDPLALAEHLRQTLADAHAAAAKLVVALRGRKKEQRALSQVFASLKSLQLNGGE